MPGSRARTAANLVIDGSHCCPWRDDHVKLISRFVPGFDSYADSRHSLDTFDIVLWAIICGAFKLAQALWLRTECESPLRLSLLVQNMCRKIREREKKRVAELQETEDFFNQSAIRLLDNLPDQETARKLLLSIDSPKATLGGYKSRRLNRHVDRKQCHEALLAASVRRRVQLLTLQHTG